MLLRTTKNKRVFSFQRQQSNFILWLSYCISLIIHCLGKPPTTEILSQHIHVSVWNQGYFYCWLKVILHCNYVTGWKVMMVPRPAFLFSQLLWSHAETGNTVVKGSYLSAKQSYHSGFNLTAISLCLFITRFIHIHLAALINIFRYGAWLSLTKPQLAGL